MSGGKRYMDEAQIDEQVDLGTGADTTTLLPTGLGSIEIAQIKRYPPAAANPVLPVPAAGDEYYNTVAKEWRYFNGAVWIAPGGGTGGPSTLVFGSGLIAQTATVRYLFPSYDDGLSQTIAIQIEMTRAGTLQNLRVHQNVVGGGANRVSYTVRKNGVVTALVVTMLATALSGADIANAVAVVAGDLIDIEITKPDGALGGGNDPHDVAATFELA